VKEETMLARAVKVLAATCALLAFAPSTSHAQTYPSGPVKLIVPVPAGGVTDIMARIVAQRLTDPWGQSVVVENRPGGNTGVGAQAVERSPADGHTLLVTSDATFTANPILFSKLSYDPKQFTPIIALCRTTPMLIVHPSVPVKSVQELIAYAKANPGKLTYGSFGIGTYSHLSMEDLKHRTGIEMVHVPYRGAAPALNGLLGGEVNVMFLTLASFEEHEKLGKVRILAAATEKRAVARPEFPTVGESGLPGFQTSVWFGMWGPANLPPAVVSKIHADVSAVLELPTTRDYFVKNSFSRVDGSPTEFARLIENDLRHWEAVIKTAGVKIE
jgi:tripartite-type tricarboxylate transporter receptor subunit TctC